MSALLAIVEAAREARDTANRDFVRAVVRAKRKHSYAQVAAASGLTRAGVQHVLRREKERNGR